MWLQPTTCVCNPRHDMSWVHIADCTHDMYPRHVLHPTTCTHEMFISWVTFTHVVGGTCRGWQFICRGLHRVLRWISVRSLCRAVVEHIVSSWCGYFDVKGCQRNGISQSISPHKTFGDKKFSSRNCYQTLSNQQGWIEVRHGYLKIAWIHWKPFTDAG